MVLAEFDTWVRALLRPHEVADADRAINGVQVACSSRPLERVAFAVDACLESIGRAAAWDADLLFVHHGIFWGTERPLTDNHYLRVRELIRCDMGLYAMHLPLDVHPELGNNAQIANILELEERRPFGEHRGTCVGIAGQLPRPRPARELAELLDSRGVLPFGPAEVRSVAVVGGSAPRMALDALEEGLDCFITGEFTHELYHDCLERRLTVLYGGHYRTEVYGVRELGRVVREQLGIETTFIDLPTGL
jgi:dinuclear metal center YbgI/SA1388 family protein